MTLTRDFLKGACLSFFGLLLSVEILLRLTIPSGFWYRHFDVSGDMTSRAELRDRIRYAVPPEHRVLLLGDSVLGASALMEHRIPGARLATLSRILREDLRPDGFNALSLGSDGLLLPDIEGLTAEWKGPPPEKILLLLNFRMFSKEFAEGSKALSRNFLLSNLPEEIRKRLAPETPPGQEARLSDGLYEWMCGHWALFRETQAAKTLWYYPSQKDFFQRQLEGIVGSNDTEADIIEAALKQKVAPYYQPYLWDRGALPFASLKNVLDQWVQRRVPLTVVLTPQNAGFLGSYLDKPSFEKNRKALAAFLKTYRNQGLIYEDWSGKYPPSFFLDHCHLKPEGNRRYAADLQVLLEGKRP